MEMVVVLAETELVFFIAACVVLWFGFVSKAVWTTQRCFCYW